MRIEDQHSFTEIIVAHEALIYKVCSIYASDSEDKKDLFQEIVLQAWSAYGRFNKTAKVSTWLYRIALNTAITHLRKQKKKLLTDIDIGDLPLDIVYTQNEQHEEYKVMHSMITFLPPLERALILLYLDDRSHAEMSDILGISTSNVSTKLMRIREKLKKQVLPLFK